MTVTVPCDSKYVSILNFLFIIKPWQTQVVMKPQSVKVELICQSVSARCHGDTKGGGGSFSINLAFGSGMCCVLLVNLQTTQKLCTPLCSLPLTKVP